MNELNSVRKESIKLERAFSIFKEAPADRGWVIEHHYNEPNIFGESRDLGLDHIINSLKSNNKNRKEWLMVVFESAYTYKDSDDSANKFVYYCERELKFKI